MCTLSSRLLISTVQEAERPAAGASEEPSGRETADRGTAQPDGKRDEKISAICNQICPQQRESAQVIVS